MCVLFDDWIDDVHIQTKVSDHPQLRFETVVSGGEFGGMQTKTTNLDDAKMHHEIMCKWAKRGFK